MKKLKNYGFTLSEVLITLAIIGVVAAITVPTLMANYTKQAKSAKLKKAASVVSQACKKALADNGTGDIRNTDLYEAVGTSVSVEEATKVFNKYFNIANDVKVASRSFPFQEGSYNHCTENYKYFTLSDGITVLINLPSNYAKEIYKTELEFYVDLDSIYKGPNISNFDVFHIPITSSGSLALNIYDPDSLTTNITCNNVDVYGHGELHDSKCFIDIVKNNWQFNYKKKGSYPKSIKTDIKSYYDHYMKNNGGN